MIISLSNYIMENDVSSASIDDIYEEQFAAQFDVASCIAEAYCKQLQMLNAVDDDYFTESEYFAEEFDNKQTWEATGNKVKDFFGRIWTAIKNALATVANWFISIFQKIKGFFSGNTEEQVKKAVNKLENMTDEEKSALVIQVPAAIFSSDAKKRSGAGWSGEAATDWREGVAVFKLQIEILQQELFPSIDRVTELMQKYQDNLEKGDKKGSDDTAGYISKEIDKFDWISNKILKGKHTRNYDSTEIGQHQYYDTKTGSTRIDYDVKKDKKGNIIYTGPGAINRGDKQGRLDNSEEIYTSPKKRYKLVDTTQFKSTGMIELKYGEIMDILKSSESIMLSGFKERIESCEQKARDLQREISRLGNYEEIKRALEGLTGDEIETAKEQMRRNVNRNAGYTDVEKKNLISDIDSYGGKNDRFSSYTGKTDGHTMDNLKLVSEKLTKFNDSLGKVFAEFKDAYKKVFDTTKKVIEEVIKWDKKQKKNGGLYGDTNLTKRAKEALALRGKIRGLYKGKDKDDPDVQQQIKRLEYKMHKLEGEMSATEREAYDKAAQAQRSKISDDDNVGF